MEKRVLIVEGDSGQREKIVRAVRRFAGELNKQVKVYSVRDVTEATRFLKHREIDLLVLDVVCQGMSIEEMPEICLVEKLRQIEKYILLPVVFISSEEELREYAFTELYCLGFQPRTFEEDTLCKVLKKGLHHTTKNDDNRQIVLKRKNMLYPVWIKDIIYVESERKGLSFYLNDGSVLEVPRRTLTDLHEVIKCSNMVQCSRKVLVNTDYIVKMNKEAVFLLVKEELVRLHLGYTYKKALKTAIQ